MLLNQISANWKNDLGRGKKRKIFHANICLHLKKALPRSSCTAYSMNILFNITRKIIVEHMAENQKIMDIKTYLILVSIFHDICNMKIIFRLFDFITLIINNIQIIFIRNIFHIICISIFLFLQKLYLHYISQNLKYYPEKEL